MVYFHKTPSGKFIKVESIEGFKTLDAKFIGIFYGRQDKPIAHFADRNGKYGRVSINQAPEQWKTEYGY